MFSWPYRVLLFSLLVACAFGLSSTRSEDSNSINLHVLDELMTALTLPKLPPKYAGMLTPNRYRQLKLGHFIWNNCGSSSDPIQLSNLTIAPDPIKHGNPLIVSASGQLSVDIDSPLEVDVTIQKKVFVWITLPCVDLMGSCTYADVCSLLPPPPCPAPFQQAKLPCNCPVPAGNYSVSDVSVELDPKKFPSWLSEGEFKAQVLLKRHGQQLGCYAVELNIVAP